MSTKAVKGDRSPRVVRKSNNQANGSRPTRAYTPGQRTKRTPNRTRRSNVDDGGEREEGWVGEEGELGGSTNEGEEDIEVVLDDKAFDVEDEDGVKAGGVDSEVGDDVMQTEEEGRDENRGIPPSLELAI